MYPYANTIKYLPKDLLFFKNIIIKEKDPIRREVLNFEDISFIIGNISKFPVNSDQFLKITSLSEDKELIRFLSTSYLNYRSIIDVNKYNILNLINNEDEYIYIKYFIDMFFDYTNPINDKKSTEILWIYPKLNIKRFISQNYFNNKFKEFYFDYNTLKKLILIMSGFAKYEYDNYDEGIIEDFKDINYPTLVLANISLYEKGFLKISDEKDGLGVSLDIHGSKNSDPIFTKNDSWIKEVILETINTSTDIKYTLSDFL